MRTRRELIDLLKTIAAAAVIAVGLNSFVLQVTDVRQRSMEHTLIEGDKVVVLKVWRSLGRAEIGQVVTFQLADRPVAFVKRIVGLPGDVIDIRDGALWRNGARVEEPYAEGRTSAGTTPMPYTVPADSVFVLGDNREASNDSRVFGAVPSDRLIGLVTARIWPLGRATLGVERQGLGRP